MYLRTLKSCVLIYASLTLQKKISAPRLASQAALKNTKIKLDLLIDNDMLLMIKTILEKKYVTLFIDMQKLITNT